jgi:uncharacterized membrane protein YoaK (UPF0700 family)
LISQLPRWVELGAFWLALLAGSINAVGLLGFQHQSVSHLTGTTTLLGLAMLDLSGDVVHLFLILMSFILGAVISGVLLESNALKLGRNYGVALVIESGLLFGAMFVLGSESVYGHYLASAACGLQNALVTTFSGAVIRTTHVTGLFTDLGLMLGKRLRGQAFDRRRAILYLVIIVGFIIGAVIGAFFYRHYNYQALALPALMCLLLAGLYAWYAQRQTN